jgi:hypothetical protein
MNKTPNIALFLLFGFVGYKLYGKTKFADEEISRIKILNEKEQNKEPFFSNGYHITYECV